MAISRVVIAGVICLALLAAAPATGPSESAAFTPPANWPKVEQEKLTIFVAPDAKEGNSTALVLWPAGHLDGDFAAAFIALRQDARGAFDPLRSGEVKTLKLESGYECLSVQEVLQDAAGRKSLRNYFALRSGDRMQVCMFVADTLEGFSAHAKEADAFVASLRLPAATSQPVK